MPKAAPEDSLVESRRKRNAAWQADAAELTAKVRELFRAASSRFNPPNEWSCNHVAQMLMVIRDRAKAREGRLGNDPCQMARKYAGAFLKHAPLAATALGTRVEVAETMTALGTINLESTPATAPEAIQRARLALRRLQEAVRAVEAVRADLNFRPMPDREPIRFVAEQAQQAWAFANGGKAPCGRNAAAPLVKFTAAAMAAIGMKLSTQEVSDVLKNRRRKQGHFQ